MNRKDVARDVIRCLEEGRFADRAAAAVAVGTLVFSAACVDVTPETPGAFYAPPDPLPDAPRPVLAWAHGPMRSASTTSG
jgi:hypothetical protein